MHSSVSVQRADVDRHLGVLRGMPNHSPNGRAKSRCDYSLCRSCIPHSALTDQEHVDSTDDIFPERPRAEHSAVDARLSLQRFSLSGLRTEDGQSPSQPPQHQYSQDTRTERHRRFERGRSSMPSLSCGNLPLWCALHSGIRRREGRRWHRIATGPDRDQQCRRTRDPRNSPNGWLGRQSSSHAQLS